MGRFTIMSPGLYFREPIVPFEEKHKPEYELFRSRLNGLETLKEQMGLIKLWRQSRIHQMMDWKYFHIPQGAIVKRITVDKDNRYFDSDNVFNKQDVQQEYENYDSDNKKDRPSNKDYNSFKFASNSRLGMGIGFIFKNWKLILIGFLVFVLLQAAIGFVGFIMSAGETPFEVCRDNGSSKDKDGASVQSLNNIKGITKVKDGFGMPVDYLVGGEGYTGQGFKGNDNDRGIGVPASEDFLNMGGQSGDMYSRSTYAVAGRWEYVSYSVKKGMWPAMTAYGNGSTDGVDTTISPVFTNLDSKQYSWTVKQKVLVINPVNGKGVVCVVGDGQSDANWGGSPLNAGPLGLSYKAQEALGFKVDGQNDGKEYNMNVRDSGLRMEAYWVAEDTKPGPVEGDFSKLVHKKALEESETGDKTGKLKSSGKSKKSSKSDDKDDKKDKKKGKDKDKDSSSNNGSGQSTGGSSAGFSNYKTTNSKQDNFTDEDVAKQLYIKINNLRNNNGFKTIGTDSKLQDAAQRAVVGVQKNGEGIADHGNDTPHLQEAGYDMTSMYASANRVWVSGNSAEEVADAMVKMWFTEVGNVSSIPWGHRRLMLNPYDSPMGIGVARMDDGSWIGIVYHSLKTEELNKPYGGKSTWQEYWLDTSGSPNADPDKWDLSGKNNANDTGNIDTTEDKGGAADTCGNSGKLAGKGNSSLADAYVSLAWETVDFATNESTGGNGTPLYIQVKDQILPGDPWYQSCDRGVCTAVRWAGYDDEYPAGPCPAVLSYMETARGKEYWEHVGDNLTVEEMKPGDILVNSGHTSMYVGEDAVKAKYPNSNGNMVHSSIGFGLGSANNRPPAVDRNFSTSGKNDFTGTMAGSYSVFRSKKKEANSKYKDVKADKPNK